MIKLLGIIFAVILVADVWINDKQIIKASVSLLKNFWTKLKSMFSL